jgi:pheromone shutdown protein TraB
MVCVELDEGRYASITEHGSWAKLDISKVLKEGKGFLLIANITLSSFQRRLGGDLGVKPGEEMLAAINTAKEMGIPFSLCDREVQLTLRRAWASCGLLSKCKLLATLLSSAFFTEKLSAEEIEKLKNSSELDSMMQELSKYLPAIKKTLIDERDQYLAAKIWAASEKAAAASNGSHTIAVVGAGHLPGIQAWLEKLAAYTQAQGYRAEANQATSTQAQSNPTIIDRAENIQAQGYRAETKQAQSNPTIIDRAETDQAPNNQAAGIQATIDRAETDQAPCITNLSEIEAIPPKSFFSKALKWVFPAIILSLFAFGFIRNGAGQSLEMLRYWVLWNGSFAALGCILALGHPLAILVSFLSAPLTTGNPFMASGILSGLVQAAIRKPRVSDAENITADVTSLKGIYRNRITRVLLVFFLTNLGSTLGTLPAVISITGLLVK